MVSFLVRFCPRRSFLGHSSTWIQHLLKQRSCNKLFVLNLKNGSTPFLNVRIYILITTTSCINVPYSELLHTAPMVLGTESIPPVKWFATEKENNSKTFWEQQVLASDIRDEGAIQQKSSCFNHPTSDISPQKKRIHFSYAKNQKT